MSQEIPLRPLPTGTLTVRLAQLDWPALVDHLDREGFAVTPTLLEATECAELKATFDRPAYDAADGLLWSAGDGHPVRFRSTIDMARYNFGQGCYRYFARPLPGIVDQLRTDLYPPLAKVANQWNSRLADGPPDVWPSSLQGLTERCAKAGQQRPTPLLLRYREGDYNCLHQDLYGDVHFPLQVVVMLSDPRRDFSGGELVLVEQRPRLQSRPIVVPLALGEAAIIPVRDRPRLAKRGWSRSQMRHGVSRIRSGERFTLGIIFHDAK